MADDDISKMDIGQLFSDNPLMESENKYFYEALKSMYSDEKTKTHIPPNEVKLLLQILFYRNMIKDYLKIIAQYPFCLYHHRPFKTTPL